MEALKKSGKRFKVALKPTVGLWSPESMQKPPHSSPSGGVQQLLFSELMSGQTSMDRDGSNLHPFLLRRWVCALNLWLHRSNKSIFYLLLRPHVQLQQPQPLWCSPLSGSQVGRQALDVKQPCRKSPRHIAQHLLLKSVSKPRETILIKKGREKER